MIEAVLSWLFESLLGGLLEHRKRKKELSRQLDAHKCSILHIQLTHNYPVELNRFRTFILNSNLLDKPPFERFYKRWLTHPLIEGGILSSGLFTDSEIAELHRDVAQLKL